MIPDITRKLNNNRMYVQFGLIIVCTFILALPGYALPGQKLTTLMDWAKNHSLLKELRPYPLPCFVFNTQAREYTSNYWLTRGVQLGFKSVVIVSSGIVVNESIFIASSMNTGRKLPVENRNDREGLVLIQSIYGKGIADDFHSSQYLEINQEKQFQIYRGRLFGYVITKTSFRGSFFIIPLNLFDANISNLRKRGELYYCADAE
jgi:hypothetical protein